MRPCRLALSVGSLLILASMLVGSDAASASVPAPPLPAGADASWWESASSAIELSEYEARTHIAGGFTAPNRAHGFRTFFEANGIRVVPRTEGSEDWHLRIAVSQAEPVQATANGSRVEYRHPGIAEWYVNSPDGLEHGFEIESAPAEVRLMVSGSLTPLFSQDGSAVDFVHDGARVLRYASLRAYDATGRELPAKLRGWNEHDAGGIRIDVDDAGAVYPLTIDPLLTSPSWSAEGDQVLAYFGWIVAAAGDVNGDGYDDVIVGAQRFDNGQTDEGRVWVYHGSVGGLQAVAWTAESDQAVALFGSSVSTAGDVNADGYSDVLIGARQYDAGLNDQGGAFLFLGSASGLNTNGTRPVGRPSNADWTGLGVTTASWFGTAVSTAADLNADGFSDVIIGAPGFDDGEVDEGAAYVYLGTSTGLSATPAWSAQGNQDSAAFGAAVSWAGDVNGDGHADVLVGADQYTFGQTAEGQVFAYYGSLLGLPQETSWTARGEQAVARFGASVATAGDVNGDGFADIVIGAPLHDQDQPDEGSLFVFHGGPNGLHADGTRLVGTPANADWQASSGQASAQFGNSVAPAGDLNGDSFGDVIVGSTSYSNGESAEGAAFAYFGSASGLGRGGARPRGTPANADWSAESNQSAADFGASVATAGDVNGDGFTDLVVGVPRYDNPHTDEGRAYLYLGSSSGPATIAGWQKHGEQYGMQLGWSVSSAGDVNGDGYTDVIIGAPYYNAGDAETGAAHLFLGSPAGLSTTATWSAVGPPDSEYGTCVSGAGDVNGDGYDDVAVSATGVNVVDWHEGRVYVYHGSPYGLGQSAAWTAESTSVAAHFGYSVSAAGDVNGDGYGDLIVGWFHYADAYLNEGEASVFHGSAAGLSASPVWSTPDPYNHWGGGDVSVSSAGDVNGDGFSDVIVGSPFDQSNGANTGRAAVYLGSAAGLLSEASWTRYGVYGETLGAAVSSAGDINGDGFSDVLVGAPLWFDNWNYTGRVLVFLGSGQGLFEHPAWTLVGNESYQYFGSALSSAGDVNGDGYSDVLVGAYGAEGTCYDNGEAFLYLGSAVSLGTSPQWTITGEQCSQQLGRSVASAGDVNGDGFGDIIVGSPSYDHYGEDGRAQLFYGNGGLGGSYGVRQRRADDSAPIAPLGWSDSETGFRLLLNGHSPYGSAKMKLQWEAEAVGTVFDGLGMSEADQWTLGPHGLDELIAGLPESTAYHWRVRVLYDRGTSPLLQASRWLSGWWNGAQETDLALPRSASLSLTMTDDPDPYVINLDSSGIRYLLQITNSGPEQASVTIDDTLPQGADFISALPSQGTCQRAERLVTCNLGALLVGTSATVEIKVTPTGPGTYVNSAALRTNFADPDPSDNAAEQITTAVLAALGDRVWEDRDGNGLQDAGEPAIVAALVYLFDGNTGAFIDVTFTDSNGRYRFESVTSGPTYRLRFIPPPGYVIAPRDQGADDEIDSDADEDTGNSSAFSLGRQDATRWDAGMVPSIACVPPDEAVYVYRVTLTEDDNHFPVLHWMDPNQPTQITGYNVYRSSDPALPHASWPLVASDIIDMDEGTPNKQWVDASGETAPGGIWYYHVVAYNHRCPAEGPW